MRKIILLRIYRPLLVLYCKKNGGFFMKMSLYEVLDDLGISTTVIFSGAVNAVFADVAAARAYARRFELDKKCRVTRHFTFWCGWFAAVRLDWRRARSAVNPDLTEERGGSDCRHELDGSAGSARATDGPRAPAHSSARFGTARAAAQPRARG